MTPRGLRVLGPAAAACVAAALAFGRAATADDAGADARMAELAPLVVTVKASLRVDISFSGQSHTQERTMEGDGTLVDPSGIVVVGSHSQILRAFERRLGSRLPGLTVSMTPTHIRVTLPDDPAQTEHPAVLLARDSVLDLAFVQILDLGDKTLPSVDWTKTGPARLGQDVYAVQRMPRGFDRAPQLFRGFLAEHVTQPRPMWDVSGDLGNDDSEDGSAVVDASGALIGFISVQVASSDDDEDVKHGVIPVEAVRASLESAKKRAPEAIEHAKKGEESKPAESPKEPAPDGSTKPGSEPAPAPSK